MHAEVSRIHGQGVREWRVRLESLGFSFLAQLFLRIACTLCDWSSRGGEGVAEFLRMRLQVSRDGIFLWKEALLPVDGKASLDQSLSVHPGRVPGAGRYLTVVRTQGHLCLVRA